MSQYIQRLRNITNDYSGYDLIMSIKISHFSVGNEFELYNALLNTVLTI